MAYKVHVVTNPMPHSPAYNSTNLLTKYRKSKDEVKRQGNSIEKIFAECCGPVLFTITLSLSIPIPIIMIAIGSVYLNQCNINPKIPIWLIVFGIFVLLKILLILLSYIFRSTIENKYVLNIFYLLTSFLALVLFAWFICGNVWVYSVYGNVKYSYTNISSPDYLNYCNQIIYLSSFWTITCSYIIGALICLCCCCALIAAGCGLGIAGLFFLKF